MGSIKVRSLNDGPIPLATEVKDSWSKISWFERASEAAQRLGAGRRVAVLSLSYEGFETYLKAMNYRDRFIAIQWPTIFRNYTCGKAIHL